MAAKDLYCSVWFGKAKRFVEERGGPWFVLSAKYGLVGSDEEISPYELTLNQMKAPQRRAWSDRVLEQLFSHVEEGSIVTILAGAHYREHLIPRLEERGVQVSVPMKGLGIGEQLSWLSANT